jgi:hypothetical protein
VVSPAASPGAGDDATPTERTQAMTSGTGTVNFDEESETEDDDAEMNEDDDTAEPTETPKVTDTATA